MKRNPQVHELKTAKTYFELADQGIKSFELRFDDRDFLVGDTLILKEFHKKQLTGRTLEKKIKYILRNYKGLQSGYVILELEGI